MQTLELTCRACGHREECRPIEMLGRLRQLGMLRRIANPEPALLEELFFSSLDRMKCPACGQTGIVARACEEESWFDGRMCQSCGMPIPKERLEVLPDAKRCVKCENTV